MKKTKVNFGALDGTEEELKAAADNWRLLHGGWCKCKNPGTNVAYYRDSDSGSHGWMCAECLGIVQTG